MGKEEEDYDSLNLLSLNDFQERGIKIDKKWTGLDALVAVASLASKKIEEERIRKEKQKKPVEDDQSNLYYQFPTWKLFEQANSQSTSEPRASLAGLRVRIRVSDQKQKDKVIKQPVTTNDLYSKKAQGFYNIARNYKLMGDSMKAGYWVSENAKQKKLKSSSTQDFSKPNKKPKRERPFVPKEIPNLPQEFREIIEQLNGSKIELVIQKGLFPTDISEHHYRLSIPSNQIVSKDFLTDDEKRCLDNGGHIKVKMIEPLLEQCVMTFKRAENLKDKNKSNKAEMRAKTSFCYVLIRDWNVVRVRNKLKLNDIIQLWKFRLPNEQLCMAFVLVDCNGSKACEDQKLGDNGAKTSQGTGEYGINGNNGSNCPTSAATGPQHQLLLMSSPMNVNYNN